MTARTESHQDATGATATGRFNSELFEERCKALGVEGEAEKAALVGVDPSTIYRFRTGEIGPRLAVARRFAETLGVSVDELWPQS